MHGMRVGRELDRTIRVQLFSYRKNKAAVNAFRDDAVSLRGSTFENEVHSPTPGDPTAENAMNLAEMPAHMKNASEWCSAIEAAYSQIKREDGRDPFGTAYLMSANFGLFAPAPGKEDHEKAVNELCAECGISKTTFYRRIDEIVGTVKYYAAKRSLI